MNKINKLSLIYILEFILSLIMSIVLFILVNINNYQDILNIKFNFFSIWIMFLILIPCIFSIIFIIYRIVKNCTKELHNIFMSIMVPIGMLYLIFLIPGHVPDENAHYYRAYEISTGILISKTNDKQAPISYIPEDLLDINNEVITDYSGLIEKSLEKTSFDNKKETFSLTQSYFPILYIFPSISMFLARIFNFNMIFALYFARLINFIVFLLLGYYTIKLIPFGKVLMTTYLFIPMIIHQGVSLSADSIVNSMLLLFITFILNLYFKKEQINRKNKIHLCLFSLFVAIAKTAYAPLILISLILLFKKNNEIDDGKNFLKKVFNKKNIYIFVAILLCIVIPIIWFVFLNNFKEGREFIYEETSYLNETFSILKHPFKFIKLWLDTFIVIEKYLGGCYYIKTFIGSHLGWLNIHINNLVIYSYMFLLIVSPFLEKHKVELNKKHKFLFVSIFTICTLLIFLAMYIFWVQHDIGYIDGVQGRYFIPLFLLLLLCLCYKDNNKYIKLKHFNLLYPLVLIILNISVIYQIICFFV